MKRPLVTFVAFAYLLIVVYLVGASSGCMFDKPEPDCEPPPVEQCEFDGQILWPEPLCAYECVIESEQQ